MNAQSQYSLAKHTILSLIYKIALPNRLLYLLNDPTTKSLIIINDPKLKQSYLNLKKDQNILGHIQNIQKISGSKLKFSFENYCEESSNKNNQLSSQIQCFNPKNLNDLTPKIIGDLSFCFISASGYLKQYSLIAVTHMTSSSTKLPVLFPGKMIGVSSIDYSHQQCKSEDYIKSLQKIKYFPNQTYIFPQKKVQKTDLLFAQAVLKADLIQQKLSIFDQHLQKDDKLIPTTIFEQKMMNPFLNINKALKNLLSSVQNKNISTSKGFQILKKLRKDWKHSQSSFNSNSNSTYQNKNNNK